MTTATETKKGGSLNTSVYYSQLRRRRSYCWSRSEEVACAVHRSLQSSLTRKLSSWREKLFCVISQSCGLVAGAGCSRERVPTEKDATPRFALQRWRSNTPQKALRILGSHERFSGKGSMNACSSHSANIFHRSNATLTDHDVTVRNQRRQHLGSSKVDSECSKVSVIDANK